VIVLDSVSNALPAGVPFAAFVLELLRFPVDRVLYIIQSNGDALRLTTPRP